MASIEILHEQFELALNEMPLSTYEDEIDEIQVFSFEPADIETPEFEQSPQVYGSIAQALQKPFQPTAEFLASFPANFEATPEQVKLHVAECAHCSVCHEPTTRYVFVGSERHEKCTHSNPVCIDCFTNTLWSLQHDEHRIFKHWRSYSCPSCRGRFPVKSFADCKFVYALPCQTVLAEQSNAREKAKIELKKLREAVLAEHESERRLAEQLEASRKRSSQLLSSIARLKRSAAQPAKRQRRVKVN